METAGHLKTANAGGWGRGVGMAVGRLNSFVHLTLVLKQRASLKSAGLDLPSGKASVRICVVVLKITALYF